MATARSLEAVASAKAAVVTAVMVARSWRNQGVVLRRAQHRRWVSTVAPGSVTKLRVRITKPRGCGGNVGAVRRLARRAISARCGATDGGSASSPVDGESTVGVDLDVKRGGVGVGAGLSDKTPSADDAWVVVRRRRASRAARATFGLTARARSAMSAASTCASGE